MTSQNDIQLFFEMGKASNDGYFVFDISTKTFTYLNDGIERIYETPLEEIKQHPSNLMLKIAPDDIPHVKSCYEELLESGGEKKYIYKLALSQNREKYLKCSAMLLGNVHTGIISGIIEDVTIQRQNEIHIEQINARKNVTLEVLGHDLKEPFAMIKMAASSLETNIGSAEAKVTSATLKFIRDMCERNIKLVRSVINHEFLKSSIVAIKKERTDVVWELFDVIRFYNRSHLRELRHFNVSSSHEKIYIALDSMKFTQVINNLISNAVKFTDKGGTIDVFAEDRGETVVISVSDNGIGIPPEILNNLFKGSKDVLRKGLNGEESGGLGMKIIKEIVSLHQGKIWVVSEVGVGTSFFIALPKNIEHSTNGPSPS